MDSVWQSEGAYCVVAQNELLVLFRRKQILHPFADNMISKTGQVVILSEDIAICLALLVLFSIITVKSHCCDRQYSRKQRIFFYLLLASLGRSCVYLCWFLWIGWFRDGRLYVIYMFTQLLNVLFCCAALYMCFEVYTTLRRTEFHCLRFRFHTVVEEVCLLIVVIIIAAGYTAADVFVKTHDFGIVLVLYLPFLSLWFVIAISIALVLVQLCVACRRVEGGQVANRLRRPAIVTVALLVWLVGYMVCFVGVCVALGKEDPTLVLVFGTGYTITPHIFVIFFGWKMLQDLDCQCCCRRYRRGRGYGQIPGQEERGVLSAQTGVPSTTRTYHTCDDVITKTGIYHTCDDVHSITRTYDTCDESKSIGWSQGFSVKLPPLPQ